MPNSTAKFLSLLLQPQINHRLKWSLVYLCLAIWGCGISSSSINHFNLIGGPEIANIHDLKLKQPNTVYLHGKVVEIVPLINKKVYKLQDSTDNIWVLTRNPVQQGQQMLVKGTLRYQSIILAGKDVGEVYIQEQVRGQGE